MQALELTDKHKSKILKMCKVLFPEYDWIQTRPHNESIIQLCKNAFDRDESHWHELSWKILNQLATYKKLSPIEIRDAVQLHGLICFNQSPLLHPIDYLYEMFKTK